MERMSSSCLVPPAKRVWRGIRARLRLRRTTTGLGRLRKEVRTCEYSDIHVMWEMLSKQPTRGGSGVRDDTPRRRPTAGKGAATQRPRNRNRKAAAAAAWSRLASYCCAL